jgi:pimeloyl-ACP methyl ester carboxylesterase
VAFVQAQGTRIAYDEAGTGPAVVLCHAGIADRRMWTGPYEALAGAARVVRFDWRGYGGSGPATEPHALHTDLLALLDALDIDRAVLAGCSVGGAAALDTALAAPDRVAGLVLVSPGLSGHSWPPGFADPLLDRVQAAIPADRRQAYREGTNTTVDPADLDAIAEAHADFWIAGPRRTRADVDPHVWTTAVTMVRDVFHRAWTEHPVDPTEPETRPADVAVPTVLVNALDDIPAIHEIADRLTAEIPGLTRIDLPDTGHLPPLERPTEVTAAIATLLG